MMVRSLGLHLGILAIASALGARAWLVEDDSKDADATISVWQADADGVERVEFSSEHSKLSLEAKSDAAGRYFVGELDREKKKSPASPHAQPPEPEETSDEEPEREQVRFVSVKEGTELAESLAKLSAKRSLGKLDAARESEFGFGDEEAARLAVVIGGQRRELVVGDNTPGGSDVYAKTGEGDVFVIDGQITRDLQAAEARLMERSYASWEPDDVASARVKAEGGSRKLKRSEEQKFWADEQSPEEKDETASNWMEKLERLRIVEYVEHVQGTLRPLFAVEFFGADGTQLGSVEVGARPTPEGDKEEYLVRSPHTRWWGRVLSSSAEQLSQDISSLVQP